MSQQQQAAVVAAMSAKQLSQQHHLAVTSCPISSSSVTSCQLLCQQSVTCQSSQPAGCPSSPLPAVCSCHSGRCSSGNADETVAPLACSSCCGRAGQCWPAKCCSGQR